MAGAKIAGPLEDPDSIELAAAGFARLENRMRRNMEDAARADGRLRYTSDQALGRELRNRLRSVYRKRVAGGLAIGRWDGWAEVICRVAARCDSEISVDNVSRHCAFIGVEIPSSILALVVAGAAAAFAADALSHSPELLGEMIQLTSAEREECGIDRLIDACDESKEDRRKRLAAERQRRRRERLKAGRHASASSADSGGAMSRPPISFNKE